MPILLVVGSPPDKVIHLKPNSPNSSQSFKASSVVNSPPGILTAGAAMLAPHVAPHGDFPDGSNWIVHYFSTP